MSKVNQKCLNAQVCTHTHTPTHTHTCTHTHTHTHTPTDVDDDSADILEQLSGLEFEYRALGIHLHLPPGKVNEIQENNPHNASAALGQIITQWLMMNYEYNKFGKPSWRMLTEAISTVDLDHAKLVAGNHKKVLLVVTIKCSVRYSLVLNEAM